MNTYRPPLDDIAFCLEEFADLPGLIALPDFAELSPDLVSRSSKQPAASPASAWRRSTASATARAAGWRTAWSARRKASAAPMRSSLAGGWNGVPFDPAHGGQGLPWSLAASRPGDVGLGQYGLLALRRC